MTADTSQSNQHDEDRRNPRHGNRHTHHFDPGQAHYLTSAERLREIRAADIVEELELEPGMNVLDLGTGSGAFLPSLSKQVGDDGNVYAVDVSPDWLRHARQLALDEDLTNVSVIRNTDRSLPLRSNHVDRVIMVCLLHELTYPDDVLADVARVTRSGGRAVIMDWKHEETEEGPPLEHRVDFPTARDWLRQAGFGSIQRRDWSDANYLITARKGDRSNE